ncbi:hypothetical protein [Streptomyces cinereoruber]|uniref:hypothetical protein n=1 Tax=Streptomyces cinereoruber TaxID=67260 RepID=UPI003C2DAB13
MAVSAVQSKDGSLGLLMCALPVGTITGELLAGSFLSAAAARSRLVPPVAVTGVLPYLLYAVRPGVALAAEFVPVHAVVAGTGVVGTLCLLAAAAELRATEGRDGADRHVPHG